MRLIDADSLSDKIKWERPDGDELVKYYIDRQPTIDAHPVIHAKWDKISKHGLYWYVCSNCKEEVPFNRYKNWMFSNFCPNCGAKMDSQ